MMTEEQEIEKAEENPTETLELELQEFKDKYFRALADQENARKRLQKERHETTQYAIQSVIAEFLGPIDHLERALSFTGKMSDETKSWAQGFEMILTQLKDVLSGHGVVPIDAVGKPFDPHLHEAIDMIETDEYPPGTVVQENLKGYRMGDKTIRPSRVSVAKAHSANEKNEEIEQEEQPND